MGPLNELTATEIVAAIAAGRTSAEAVVRACLDRVAEREPTVRAFAHVEPARAIAAARAFDRGGKRGPLGGVPFGVKDIIDTAELPTEWGTPIHRGRHAHRDAACVALSRRAGGIVLGKTVTSEFANLHEGPTRNPHDPQRTPGGSSQGSAAAVADFMVPIALGTQTTGSTVRPASFCGVVGFRPTYGEHRLHGVMEASASFDTLGILARSVADVALYREVLLGTTPEPLTALDRAPRIGLCRTHLWERFESSTRALVEDAAARLARAGAAIAEFALPPDFAGLHDAHRWVSSFEFARTFAFEIDHRWNEISRTLRSGRLADGLNCPFPRYVEAVEFAADCRRRFDSAWGEFDVLLTAGAFGEAEVGDFAFTGAPLYQIWTALHVPAITLPVFTGPNGMPVGTQLLARRHDDRRLLACAQWVSERLR